MQRGDGSKLDKMLEMIAPFDYDDRPEASRKKHIDAFMYTFAVALAFEPLDLENIPAFLQIPDAF